MSIKNKTTNYEYACKKCDYVTNYKKDYNKHLLTKKHNEPTIYNKNYICDCGKKYSYNSSLYNHKKKCTFNMNMEIIEKQNNNYETMINTLINENKELRQTLIEQSKVLSEVIPKINNTVNGNVNNTINSNNKFNINVFLNEHCKHAISMDSFIKSIEISLSNLLFSKEKGLAQGISNIFIENINKLPLTQRPLHCTDVKRETLYIKNEIWEKDEKKEKTKEAIKKISKMQTQNVNKYVTSNPDYMKHDKKKEDYISIVRVATGDIDDKQEKIIKNICKEVYVNDGLITN